MLGGGTSTDAMVVAVTEAGGVDEMDDGTDEGNRAIQGS